MEPEAGSEAFLFLFGGVLNEDDDSDPLMDSSALLFEGALPFEALDVLADLDCLEDLDFGCRKVLFFNMSSDTTTNNDFRRP